ncbi:hypothetical protein H0H81_006055 [Sphagnurus paluster]|uniref:RNA helicase n=1 Tax=Sphagnurus paluster TaxID=117069 RepID=A0A9P7K5L1_9AGAR|nr:hypothetical protein H0H81_006055 [Sphagnurus paluster]
MSASEISTKRVQKRKIEDKSSSRRKKVKRAHRTIDELPWKTIVKPREAGIDGDDGILELEEIEGVEVVYEETGAGRVIKFNVIEDQEVPINDDLEPEEGKEVARTPIPPNLNVEEVTAFDSAELLPAWHKFSLHPQLLKALHSKGFNEPTPIQAAALIPAMGDRDVVGVAQTGSGKTLAYGLPILHYLLSQPRPVPGAKRHVRALILAPTRELALQVSSHLNACLNDIDNSAIISTDDPTTTSKNNGKAEKGRGKQKHVESHAIKPPPHVSVASIVGGMSAQKQRRILDRGVDVLVATPGRLWDIMEEAKLIFREDQIDEGLQSGDEQEDSKEEIKDGLQTFVFSATLSKDLQRNVKRRSRPKSAGKYKRRDAKPASTLVFLSSIDGIRRLMPLMELLNVKAFPLHSQLEQRQRLKNLDRFTTTPNAVLLATDIAARGLDIAAVDHVIHYQVPRSADSYVHRNGRTARAMRKGFSLLMCAPDERRVLRALLGNLSRHDEIPEISIELNLLDKLKYRVQLARKIETSHHKIKKANHERNWMRETAAAMEIELDSDYLSDDDEEKPSTQKRKAKDSKNAALKAELKHLLSLPLIARGVSAKYITSGSRPIVDDLITGQTHEKLVGLKKVEAGSSLVAPKKKKKQPMKEEFEEWAAIGAED